MNTETELYLVSGVLVGYIGRDIGYPFIMALIDCVRAFALSASARIAGSQKFFERLEAEQKKNESLR